MDELEIGDNVLVSYGKYAQVYFMGHRDRQTRAEFVNIKLEHHHELALSSLHYAKVCLDTHRCDDGNTRYISADQVKVGDLMELSSGDIVAVVKTSRVVKQGVFNPHTLHGDIVVNGVVASSYTRLVSARTAHMLLSPIRLAYRMIRVNLLGSCFDNKVDALLVKFAKLFLAE